MKNPIKNESVNVSALLDQAHLMVRGRWPAGQPRLLTNTFAELQPFHCHADSFCLCFSESNATLDITTRNSLFFFPWWMSNQKKKKMNSWQTCYHSFVNTPTRNKDFFTNFFSSFLLSNEISFFGEKNKQTSKQKNLYPATEVKL